MEFSTMLIDSFLWKFGAEKESTLRTLERLSDEDVVWRPPSDNNSIANLAAHIWGTVHQRVESVFDNIPDTRHRDKEFEPGLYMTQGEAMRLVGKSFDTLIHVLEGMKTRPELLLTRPYMSLPPITFGPLNNQSTVVDIMMQMMNHLSFHTGQIVYIASTFVSRDDLKWHISV